MRFLDGGDREMRLAYVGVVAVYEGSWRETDRPRGTNPPGRAGAYGTQAVSRLERSRRDTRGGSAILAQATTRRERGLCFT